MPHQGQRGLIQVNYLLLGLQASLLGRALGAKKKKKLIAPGSFGVVVVMRTGRGTRSAARSLTI